MSRNLVAKFTGLGPPSTYQFDPLRSEVRTAADDAKAGPAVGPLAFGPLPDVAAKIKTAAGRSPGGKRRHGRCAAFCSIVEPAR